MNSSVVVTVSGWRSTHIGLQRVDLQCCHLTVHLTCAFQGRRLLLQLLGQVVRHLVLLLGQGRHLLQLLGSGCQTTILVAGLG